MMSNQEDDNTFPCHWPGCFVSRKKPTRLPRGWIARGDTVCCPEHAAALEAADLKIEDGWSCGPHHSQATIGYEALSEKGAAFLSALHDEPNDEGAIGDGGSMLPAEVENFKRLAASAGIRLLDWTKPGGSPGLQLLAESTVAAFCQETLGALIFDPRRGDEATASTVSARTSAGHCLLSSNPLLDSSGRFVSQRQATIIRVVSALVQASLGDRITLRERTPNPSFP